MRLLEFSMGCLVLAVVACDSAQGRESEGWRVVPDGRLGLQVWRGDRYLFGLNCTLAGPAGSYAGMEAMPSVQGGRRVYGQEVVFTRSRWDKEIVAGPLSFRYEAFREGPAALGLRAACSSEKAVNIRGVELAVPASDYLAGARLTARMRDGADMDVTGRGKLDDGVKSLLIKTPTGEDIRFEFTSPAQVSRDAGALRLWPLSGAVRGGEPVESEMTVTFPHPIEFRPANQFVDTSGWFPYEGRQDFTPGSAIGMEDWLDQPAGRHGYVRIDGDRFAFEDGTPVKFWGTNISWADMAVPDEQAVRYADKFAKHGVNMVRMHKFVHEHTGLDGWPFDASSVWDGIMSPENPVEFHQGAVQRFDNMHARLRERGIYVGWSPIAFLAFHEGYRGRLTAYDELKALRDAHPFWIHGGNTLYPFSTFAPDVQDLYIELIVKLLNHVNASTGLRYAEDPALAFVEFRNESDTFFWGVDNLAAESPTYRRIISERFCEWLRQRYPSEEALRGAWTEIGLREGESLDDGTVFPFPGWGRVDQVPRSRRLVDSYRFLFEYQDDCYQRFVRAVRGTGYRGALVGSCWQAADWLGRLYNLQSDRRVGYIDRHRYFGNADRPLMERPGQSTLQAGREQVADRPFGLSEWAAGHVHAAELPPAVAFIGLGLQGWDIATQYGSNWWGIRTRNAPSIHTTSDLFYNIGQFPFIARILQSGALKEGAVVARRRVSMGDLYPLGEATGEDFDLLGGASWDDLERAIPDEALGAGRVVIDFVEQPVPGKIETADLSRHWDKEGRLIRASNGQIVWDYSGRGFFTVDTPAGQAVIGFGGGRAHALSDVTVSYDNPFANVYVVPADRGETLADARRLLIMALGRTADRGDVLEETALRPFHRPEQQWPGGGRDGVIRHMLGNPTLIFEPVALTVTLKRDEPCRVYALDPDGRLPETPVEVPVERTAGGQWLRLDGSRYRTMYYLIEFEP